VTANPRTLAAEPPLSTQQMDAGAVGSIENSVNLFRGEVNLPLDLVSFPGRNDLDLKLTALYSSSVHQAVRTWNRDAPTGVLGVGWSLPLQAILAAPHRAGSVLDGEMYLLADGGAVPLYRAGRTPGGGYAYQSRTHLFWHITYHPSADDPSRDRWEVVKEDGSVSTYGLHGIRWGVRWGNWTGATLMGGGRRFPRGWSLVSVRNVQGDEIRFEYEADEVAIGGRADQRYTRAQRLRAVVDTYGRRAELAYARKEPFELQPPHRSPGPPADAFQYEYEERFLERITCLGEDGKPLSRLHLGYTFLNAAGRPEEGYRKRYLTSVVRETAEGRRLPPTELTYAPAADDANPGALLSVRHASGGRAEYAYHRLPLEQTAPRIAIEAPGRDHTPAVWHGPDYTVVVWRQPQENRLDIRVYRWNGAWVPWSTTRRHEGALSRLEVVPHAGYFLLHYRDERLGRHAAFLYRQSDQRFGQWTEHDAQLGGEFSAGLTVGTGESFAAFHAPGRSSVRVLQWDGMRKEWRTEEVPAGPGGRTALAGRGNVLLGAFGDEQTGVTTVRLYRADGERRWQPGWTGTLQARVDWTRTRPEELWAVGDGFAAATYATGMEGRRLRSQLEILQWDAGAREVRRTVFPREQEAGVENPLLRSHAGDDVVGNAQYVYRYDGHAWRGGELGAPAAGRRYAYAWGTDLALRVEQEGESGPQEVRALQFDPYASAWRPVPELRASGADLNPSSWGEYALVGRGLWFRDPALKWRRVHELPAEVVPASIHNRTPFFLAYETRRRDGVHVVFLKDGRVAGEEVLSGERAAAGDGGPGTQLAGPQALVTYEAGSLPEARRLFLYRVVDDSVRRQPQAAVVRSATADHGYGRVATYYEYDTATAAFDPAGRVAQFASARSLRGSATGAHGWTQTLYFNGLSPDAAVELYPPTDRFTNVREYVRAFNGDVWQQRAFDASGRLVERTVYDRYAWERGGGGDPLWGVFTRLRRQRRETHAWLFDADPAHAPDLDRETLPAPLARAFEERRLALPPGTRVRAEARGRRWRLVPPGGGWGHTLVAEGGTLAVYGPVIAATEIEYNGRGQPVREVTAYPSAEGLEERRIHQRRYAWEVYPEMARRNQTSAVAEARLTVQRPGVEAVADLTVTTFREDWPQPGPAAWLPHKQYTWAGRPGTEAFDFPAWSGEGEPPRADWVRTTATTQVSPAGRPVESLDVDGTPSSVLYDAGGRFPVGLFTGASHAADEAAFWGFEAYEAPGRWRVEEGGGARITDAVSLTGRRSLLLPGAPGGGAGLTGTFRPRRGGDRRLILFSWVRTEAGGAPDPQAAGWELRVKGSLGEATVRVPLPDTGGEWRHHHRVIDPAALGVGVLEELRVALRNAQPGRAVWLDHVGLAPVDASVKLKVYDAPHHRVVAELDPIGNLRRLLHDDLGRLTAEVGAGEVPGRLLARYLWRERADGVFRPEDPSALLEVSPRRGGLYEPFHTGDGWRARWNAEGEWRVEGGVLAQSGASGGRLSLRAVEPGAVAVRLTLAGGMSPDPGFGIDAGPVRLRWRADGWTLEGAGDAAAVEGVRAPVPAGPRDVLLRVDGRAVQAWVDGRLLFARLAPEPVDAASIAVVAGGRLALAGVAVARDPMARLAYHDEAGQEIQVQRLDGDALHVAATLPDALGRPAVRTRLARLDGAAPGYRPGFAALDWSTGVLSGELAAVFPEDEGFPYWRTRYEDSPLGRTVEEGAPGRARAIDPAVPAERRRTVQHRHAALVRLPGLTDLPPGQYPMVVVTDPEKRSVASVRDHAGRAVAVFEGVVPGEGGGAVVSRCRYDARGNLAVVILPRGATGREGAFTVAMEHDAFGRQVRRTTPDTDEPYLYLYDRAGRLRFLRDARGAKEGFFRYRLYDGAGRLAEEGICPRPWDEAELRAGVDDRGWIPAPGAWKRRLEYDGDGADPALLGRLVRVRTRGEAAEGAPEVEERMDYDAEGRVIAKHLRVDEWDPKAVHTLRYRYDRAGGLESLRCETPDAAGRVELVYGFDGIGQVSRVGYRPGDGGALLPIARFERDRAGALSAEVLNPGTPDEFTRALRYDAQGSLVSLADPGFEQRLFHGPAGAEADGGGGGGRPDRVRRVETRFHGTGGTAGFLHDHAYDFEYDDVGRLVRARHSAGEAWSLGLTQPTARDLNNNLLRLQVGRRTTESDYFPGTNRLRAARGGGEISLVYSPDGAVLRSEGAVRRGLAYCRHDHTPLSATGPAGASVDLRYDVKGRRVLKKGPDSARLYLLDADGTPVLRLTRGPGGAVRREVLVHGDRGGLLAVLQGDRLYQVTADALGSTRAVFSGRTLVCAYNYLPYGELMGPAHEPGGRVVDHLFTGHEHDGELELYHFRARLYDPRLAVFYSPDPLSQFSSPYAYVGGDPVNLVDPTGMAAEEPGQQIQWQPIVGGLGGLALVLLGAAATVLTFGAGIKLLVAGAVVGGALIGGGMGMALYGATHLTNFNGAEFGVTAGLGFLAGGVGGLAFLGAAAIPNALGAFLAETVVNTLLGAASGFLTNGFNNMVQTRRADTFLDGWLTATLIGGGIGLGAGILSGAAGRSTFALNKFRTWWAGGRDGTATVHLTRMSWHGHSQLTLRPTQLGTDTMWEFYSGALIKTPGSAGGGLRASIRTATSLTTAADSTPLGHGITNNFWRGTLQPSDQYRTCATALLPVLKAAGLETPWWARTPATLYIWARLSSWTGR
jgi:RHS repeat-associated protein